MTTSSQQPAPDLRLFTLAGRRALITGSSKGIGLTLADGMARAGASVILNGRASERVEAAAARLRDEGFGATSAVFDVTDPDDVQRAIERIEREIGAVDVLVNNAGIQIRGPLSDYPLESWRSIIDTNLTGPFLVGQAVGRRMVTRGRGKIINICSLQSSLARPTIAAYTAAKGGLGMLTKAMCAEWAPHGIQVNGLGPGYLETELTLPLRQDAEFDAWLRRRTPAGRWGRPEDLVGAAIFLASGASDFVNGQILYVDGGLQAVV